MNTFALGKAIYIVAQSHQHFYYHLIVWLRQLCNLFPLLKVPDTVEVSLRQKDDTRIYFLLNHQNSPVRIQFYKPMHDFLTGTVLQGNYDLHPTACWCSTSACLKNRNPHPKLDSSRRSAIVASSRNEHR